MQQNTAGLKLGTGFFELNLNEVVEKPIEKSAAPPLTHLVPVATPEKIAKPKINVGGDKIATLVMNADLLIRNDEKKLAQHLLRQSLYLNSYHAPALHKLSSCLDNESQLALKTKVMETLKTTDYGFETLVQLAHCYYHQNDDKKAFATYHEALSTLTHETSALFEVYKNLGNIALRDGDFDGAEENYNKAHTQNSRSDVLAVNQGTLAIQRSDWENAVARFREALQVNHRNDRAWVGLAMVHNSMGDFVLAKGNVGKAVDLNPKNRTAVQLSVTWAMRDQDLGSAIETLENYVSLVDCDQEMSLLLIHLFCQRNQWIEAQLEVERLLLWDPKNATVQKVEKEIRSMSGI